MGPRKIKGRELGWLVVTGQKFGEFQDDPRSARMLKRRLVKQNCSLRLSAKRGFNNLKMKSGIIVIDDDEDVHVHGRGVLHGEDLRVPDYSDIGNGFRDPPYVDNCNASAIDVNRIEENDKGDDANDAMIIVEDDATDDLVVNRRNVSTMSVGGDRSRPAGKVNDGTNDNSFGSNGVIDVTSIENENVNAVGSSLSDDIVVVGMLNKCNTDSRSFDHNGTAKVSIDDGVGDGKVLDCDNDADGTRADGVNSDDDSDNDPEYKMFLDNLIEDGDSFIVSMNQIMADGKIRAIYFKYEADDDRPLKEDARREKMISEKRLRSVPSNKRKNSTIKTKVKKASAGPIPCRSNQRASKRLREKMLLGSSNSDYCGRDMKFDDVDPHYRFYLNSLEDGKRYSSKDDDRSLSDEEVIVLNINQFTNGDHTPFVTSRVYESFDEEVGGCLQTSVRNSYSKFREELKEILKKPYDEKECEDLLEEARCRRPIERAWNLRGGIIKRYPTETMGKSYLDQHNDLAMKIEAARNDRPKVLNLLRGFFYWLQNIARRGVFRPWMEEESVL